MREIEFRGKIKEDPNSDSLKLIDDWAYGFLVFNDFTNSCYIINNFDSPYYVAGDEGFNITEVEPESVGQYTGLKNKNGTKIYEGDIVETIVQSATYKTDAVYGTEKIEFEDRKVVGVVEWNNKGYWQLKTNVGIIEFSMVEEITEVLDNIYENPKFLEEG